MSTYSIADDFAPRRSLTPKASVLEEREEVTETPSFFEEERSRPALEFAHSFKEAVSESHADGWDGPASKKAQGRALERVSRFLSALPAAFPYPDLSIDPDGSVLLEWSKGPQISLVALIGGEGKLHFASFIRGQKIHGAMDFLGDELPSEFIAAAKSWWSTPA